MISQILAHAGEEHSDVTEAVTHFAPTHIAVPIFFLAAVIIGYLTWLVSGEKLDTVMFVLAALMLIAGFTMFMISPIVSVLSITIGIIFAGALAFLSLAGDKKN